jgi:hypothetical protein
MWTFIIMPPRTLKLLRLSTLHTYPLLSNLLIRYRNLCRIRNFPCSNLHSSVLHIKRRLNSIMCQNQLNGSVETLVDDRVRATDSVPLLSSIVHVHRDETYLVYSRSLLYSFLLSMKRFSFCICSVYDCRCYVTMMFQQYSSRS